MFALSSPERSPSPSEFSSEAEEELPTLPFHAGNYKVELVGDQVGLTYMGRQRELYNISSIVLSDEHNNYYDLQGYGEWKGMAVEEVLRTVKDVGFNCTGDPKIAPIPMLFTHKVEWEEIGH
ncbi:MAG: hypothetical protein JSS30_05150 [Verrucomicrobia bacterium]|nr:hypothetical protein [Verrucomicrobiota bacterium]